MREVTVYEVKAHKMPLYQGMDAVRIAKLAPFTYAPQVDAAFYNPVLETTDVKVHEIRGIKGSPDYIAMSPELQEILEAPVKTKIDVLEANVSCLRTEVKYLSSARSELVYRMGRYVDKLSKVELQRDLFLGQPWYVRVWRALRKDL